MRYLKPILAVCFASGTILFTGCGNTVPQLTQDTENHFYYQDHDFGPNRDTDYREGVVAGCRTSDGDYTKDHTRFRTNESYHAGWEHGRLHCKGAPAS